MCIIPYSTENPKQYSRVIKFSSVVLHSVKREWTKRTALSDFSVAHIILHRILSYLLLNTYLLTPWSRVLLAKLTGFQLVKIFPEFSGTRKLITAFTATCPYLEPARSSPNHNTKLPEYPSKYYPPFYAWVTQVVSFPQVSQPKPCIRLSSPHIYYWILKWNVILTTSYGWKHNS